MKPEEPAVLVDDRHNHLLERLLEDRRVLTNEAAAHLGVSVDTVRRDLRTLHDRGLLRRVHGGAVPVSRLPESFAGRQAAESPARTALAVAVVDRFRSGQVVGLDAGSTNVEIALQIPQTLAVTVVTNSPPAAVALANHRSAEVILLGGTVDLTWMATTGVEAVDGWRNYHLDLAVLGVCALDPDKGASTRSSHEVATKRALVAAAAHTIVPVQAEKLTETAPFHVVDIDDVDSLVVEALTDSKTVRRYRKAGIDITTC